MNTQTPPPINVRNFDHVNFVVSDLSATEHFYENVLGLKKSAARPAFDFQGHWYQLGQFFLHVILANEDSGSAGPGDRQVKRATRGQHLAFDIADFDQTLQLINQHDIAIIAGPQVRPDGASQVYIQDPDGHLIELCSVKS